MKIDRKEMGKRIKTALDNAKVTQRHLSQVLGVKEPSVTAYIQGSSKLPPEAYATIAELCGVTIDWIITGKEPIRSGVTENDQRRILTVDEEATTRAEVIAEYSEMADEFNKLSKETLSSLLAQLVGKRRKRSDD